MNEELLKIYEDNTNEFGLPVFDLFTWQNLNTKYIDPDPSLPMSKRAKVMIDTMIHFFEKHHPKFPFPILENYLRSHRIFHGLFYIFLLDKYYLLD